MRVSGLRSRSYTATLMPARFSPWARHRPPMPAPITTTCNGVVNMGISVATRTVRMQCGVLPVICLRGQEPFELREQGFGGIRTEADALDQGNDQRRIQPVGAAALAQSQGECVPPPLFASLDDGTDCRVPGR